MRFLDVHSPTCGAFLQKFRLFSIIDILKKYMTQLKGVIIMTQNSECNNAVQITEREGAGLAIGQL